MRELTLTELKVATRSFIQHYASTPSRELYQVTDGKAVGTAVEHAFHNYLGTEFLYLRGNSASGQDFPELKIDLKVTSRKQPQSSCPFENATQKVYGLGYNLLVLVYSRLDDHLNKTVTLNFQHAIFIEASKTGDYQTTFGIREILRRNGNRDDLIAFLEERNLPLDELGRMALADRIVINPPEQGYLTISNALQWRLQYTRAIETAFQDTVEGVENLIG